MWLVLHDDGVVRDLVERPRCLNSSIILYDILENQLIHIDVLERCTLIYSYSVFSWWVQIIDDITVILLIGAVRMAY